MTLISPELNNALNEQIGHEYGAAMQYVSIAAYFERQKLTLLAKLFFEQSAEEQEHAMKFVRYILDTQGELRVPAIAQPTATFKSAEEAVQAALTWELEVTDQINKLMDLAVSKNDYLGQSFLQKFVDEQLEEVRKMSQILSVVQRSGEKNLIMVEAYLIHIDKAG